MTAGYTTAAMFVIGICAYYLLKGRDKAFATRSMAVGLGFGIVTCLVAMIFGDANGVDIFMKMAAIEAERTIKSKYRYQQIIVQYLKMIKANQINKVRYVMPDESKKIMVEKAMKSIKSVTVSTNGQKRQFNLTEDVWRWFEFQST